MKTTKRQLRRIIREERGRLMRLKEANRDGTVSGNEDAEVRILMADVEEQLEELVRFAIEESDRIGGQFRGPGIRKRALRMMSELLHEYR